MFFSHIETLLSRLVDIGERRTTIALQVGKIHLLTALPSLKGRGSAFSLVQNVQAASFSALEVKLLPKLFAHKAKLLTKN